LLCHQAVPLDWSLKPERLATLCLASPVQPALPDPDVRSLDPVQFSRSDGFQVSTWDPLLKAALIALGRSWPGVLAFDELWAMTRELLGVGEESRMSDAAEKRALASHLLRCLTANLVELHAHRPRFVREPSERPVASAWARLQAATTDKVTNRRHELVPLEPVERKVLALLDGQHDRGSVQQSLEREEQSSDDESVEAILAKLAACALLVN
jgi:hypothetical protein